MKKRLIALLMCIYIFSLAIFPVQQVKASFDFTNFLVDCGATIIGYLAPGYSLVNGGDFETFLKNAYLQEEFLESDLTWYEFCEQNLLPKENTNEVEIQQPMIDLMLRVLKELKQNNQLTQNVPFRNLRIDRMYWGDKESRKDDYYKTYVRSLASYQNGEKIYPLHHAGNGIDLHNVIIQNLDKPDGHYKYKPKVSLMKDRADTYWVNNILTNSSYANFNRSGFYYIYVPWYLNGRTTDGQKKWTATQWTYGRTNQAQEEIEEPVYGTGYDELYFVGSFLNPGTTQNYQLTLYGYNRNTNSLAQVNYEYKWDFKVNIVRESTTGNSKEILDMSVTMGNPRIQSHTAAYSPNTFEAAYTALIGKEYRYVYDSQGDFYYIPMLRSDNPGMYKVFANVNDLRSYLNQGGNNSVIDDKRTIQSISYNIDDHSTTINYYGDDNDPAYPDGREDTEEEDEDGEQGEVIDYSDQLAEIIRELRQIKNKLDDLEPSSSGGDNSEIIGYLIQIRNLLSQLSNTESGANIEPYDDTELLAAIANLQEAIENIDSADYGEILNKIYKALKVNNAENALETLLQLLQMLLDWFGDRLEGAEEGAASAAETAVSALLATKFPFSVPGTMVAVLHLLDATPVAPTITIPLTINYDSMQSGTVSGNSVLGGKHYTSQHGFSESVTFDLADYPEIGDIVQFFCIISWCFFLFKMTFKVLSIKIPGEDK